MLLHRTCSLHFEIYSCASNWYWYDIDWYISKNCKIIIHRIQSNSFLKYFIIWHSIYTLLQCLPWSHRIIWLPIAYKMLINSKRNLQVTSFVWLIDLRMFPLVSLAVQLWNQLNINLDFLNRNLRLQYGCYVFSVYCGKTPW